MMTIMLSIIVLISSSVFLILLLRKEPKKEKNYTLYALASMNANIWRKMPMKIKSGQRIRCIRMEDIRPDGSIDYQARALAGAEGTVKFVDDSGSIHVVWDCGSTLALLPDADEYKILE